MQTAERCLRAPSIAVAFRHAQCADECPAFGRKADSGQPLPTNLDLRVHGAGVRGRRTSGLARGNEADATAWKTSQGSSLGEFSVLPRLPAARRDGDGSMVVGGCEIDTGKMCQRTAKAAAEKIALNGLWECPNSALLGRLRRVSGGHHDLWILKRQGRPLMRQSHHQLPMPLGVPTH